MKIRLHVATTKVGSECQRVVFIEDEEWNEMDENEREEFCYESASDMIEMWWEAEEE